MFPQQREAGYPELPAFPAGGKFHLNAVQTACWHCRAAGGRDGYIFVYIYTWALRATLPG